MSIRDDINKEIEYHKHCIFKCVTAKDKNSIPEHATAIKRWTKNLESLDELIDQAKIDARRNTILEIESILSII